MSTCYILAGIERHRLETVACICYGDRIPGNIFHKKNLDWEMKAILQSNDWDTVKKSVQVF